MSLMTTAIRTSTLTPAARLIADEIYLSVYLSYLSIYLSYLSIYLSIYLSLIGFHQKLMILANEIGQRSI